MKFMQARAMQLAGVMLLGWAMGSNAYAQQTCQVILDGGVQEQTIFAGQTINAGTVTLEVSGQDLVVTYNTIDGWELTEAHLWVGDDLADLPRTRNGNPQIGRFPYNSGDITGATEYSFTVPVAELNFTCPADDTQFLAAAHSALRRPDGSGGYQTETGWADGDRIVPRGNWATFFDFTLGCDCDDGDGDGDGDTVMCETAYAFGETELDDIPDLTNGGTITNHFGWQIGPVDVGTFSFSDLFAGAGNNRIDVAEQTGFISYDYFQAGDSCFVEVFYDTSAAQSTLGNWFLRQTHLYADTSIVQTGAPGQFGNTHEGLSDGTTIDFFSVEIPAGRLGCDPVYLVAHAEVCYVVGGGDGGDGDGGIGGGDGDGGIGGGDGGGDGDGGIIVVGGADSSLPGNGNGQGNGNAVGHGRGNGRGR